MPQRWQCDVCGARYRVGWLSHCYRCEGRPPKPPVQVEKPSRRKTRMPRIVAGVGPSNARADLEAQPDPVEVPEAEVPAVVEVAEPEPVAAVVEPDPEPVAAEVAPEPAVAPAPVVDAPVVVAKGGAA